jgi:hypothetical protein
MFMMIFGVTLTACSPTTDVPTDEATVVSDTNSADIGRTVSEMSFPPSGGESSASAAPTPVSADSSSDSHNGSAGQSSDSGTSGGEPRPGKYLISGKIDKIYDPDVDSCRSQASDVDIYFLQTGRVEWTDPKTKEIKVTGRVRINFSWEKTNPTPTQDNIHLVKVASVQDPIDLSCNNAGDPHIGDSDRDIFHNMGGHSYEAYESDCPGWSNPMLLYAGYPGKKSCYMTLTWLEPDTFYALIVLGRQGTLQGYTIELDLPDCHGDDPKLCDSAEPYRVPADVKAIQEKSETPTDLAANRQIVQ